MSHVKITVNLPVKITKKRKYYVAECPILDVVAQGETRDKSLESLKEAIQLFLESCYERGVLDDVLKQSGMELEKEASIHVLPRSRERREYQHIDVPLSLIMAQREQEDCLV